MKRGKKREKASEDPELVEVFNLFAANDELDPKGVQLALSALGIDKTDEEVNALVKKRGMELAEFARLASGLAKTRDDAEEAWECLDEDGKGFLVHSDLVNVANELQEKFSESDIEGMLKVAENKDGIVTKESFIAFFKQAGL